jgi:hypothetical protein
MSRITALKVARSAVIVMENMLPVGIFYTQVRMYPKLLSKIESLLSKARPGETYGSPRAAKLDFVYLWKWLCVSHKMWIAVTRSDSVVTDNHPKKLPLPYALVHRTRNAYDVFFVGLFNDHGCTSTVAVLWIHCDYGLRCSIHYDYDLSLIPLRLRLSTLQLRTSLFYPLRLRSFFLDSIATALCYAVTTTVLWIHCDYTLQHTNIYILLVSNTGANAKCFLSSKTFVL